MEWFNELWAWLVLNGASLVAILWTVEKLLRLISRLTSWEWDDNLADWLANILEQFFPEKKEE